MIRATIDAMLALLRTIATLVILCVVYFSAAAAGGALILSDDPFRYGVVPLVSVLIISIFFICKIWK